MIVHIQRNILDFSYFNFITITHGFDLYYIDTEGLIISNSLMYKAGDAHYDFEDFV